MSQEDFMIKDECIVLDHDDNIIGHDNKKNCHIFSTETPRGILHRAFSVFLFNSEGKLLLQQRAADKITFPSVWTNTCCSHPLYTESEMDSKEDLANNNIMGVKRAAVRKLLHELGISADQVPLEKFKFLTRLHYWASDSVTHGPESPWGEHEIDYVLFIQADVDLDPNPEEVGATRYVTYEELTSLMNDASNGLLWSPWFRIIVNRWLKDWWLDLERTLTTDDFVDLTTVHRFDPPQEHMGGGGHAGPWLDVIANEKEEEEEEEERKFDVSQKQGAYGKIPVFSDSLFSTFSRMDEIVGAVYFKLWGSKLMETTFDASSDENVQFCDNMLGKVSRSFAAVIRQLPEGLCLDVLVFYLVLRGLDTVEDDMTAFESKQKKIQLLCDFYEDALNGKDRYALDGVGEGDEKVLLQQFYKVTAVFQSLRNSSQEVIADITKRMGEGMAEFVEKDLGEGTQNREEYYRYCHFVAGLVGEGLTRLFLVNNYESEASRAPLMDTCEPMGQFLQRTNIIRDYLEDYVDGRAFWPKDVWSKYGSELGDLAKPENLGSALSCLNDMVCDALQLVPTCLDYLSALSDPKIFRFCAIPQMMAISTLEKVFNNPKTFSGVVKIRKGLAVRLILDSSSFTRVAFWFKHFALEIKNKTPQDDPNYHEIHTITSTILAKCEHLTHHPEETDKPGIDERGVGMALDTLQGPLSWVSFVWAPMLSTAVCLSMVNIIPKCTFSFARSLGKFKGFPVFGLGLLGLSSLSTLLGIWRVGNAVCTSKGKKKTAEEEEEEEET